MDHRVASANTDDLLVQVERQRANARMRERERRESMTVEERETYLARRRERYRIQRSRIVNQHGHHFATASNLPNNSTGSSTAVPHSSIPVQANPVQATTSHSTTTATNEDEQTGVVGTYRLTPLSHNPFAQPNPATQFPGSTSHANPPTSEDGDVNDDEDANSDDDNRTTGDISSYYNVARNFTENSGFEPFQLQPPRTCQHCQATLFQYETKSFCCRKGKVMLQEIPVPLELYNLFRDQSAVGRSFRRNIRAYNHIFSFTSLGVQLDEQIVGQGVYTFRAHGAIYHNIATLLPNPGNRPRYIQLFIYDTEHETENRLLENDGLEPQLVEQIKHILDTHNPFVETFRQIARHSDLMNCKLVIKERQTRDRQYVLPTASQVAAIISAGDDFNEATERDIIVQTVGGQLRTLKEYSGYYDPLQYPLLLPYGTYGWDSNSVTIYNTRVTCCDYYAYLLQIRHNNLSVLLYGGRLLHQYCVDNYVKIETQKLRYIRSHQQHIRAELYQGLQDSLATGENNAGNIGQRTILPASFIGSPRDMYHRYQDAMAIVQKLHKPDIFLTMTCNPNWTEIRDQLLPGQTPQDRPDLLTRIFKSKYEELKADIYKKGVLGKVIAHVHVVEFQKRGLPHVHMLIILDQSDKLDTPDQYDGIVSAEIPNREEEPLLYDAVIRHMIHGPCGAMNTHAPCMKNKDRSCKKKYPKQFAQSTLMGENSYPIYRRRNDGRSIAWDVAGNKVVDNRWVVPYNAWLLLKYDCHINVEICCSIISVKYLYKYVYKGPDCVVFEVRPGPNYDEVSKYVDGRWICAPEALWKMYKFTTSHMYPSVMRLQLHLPNRHQVRFYSHQRISDVLNDERNSRTMLTEFFEIYKQGTEVNQYLYREFPSHYRWLSREKKWRKRRTTQSVIGRIYAASPSEGERFYERILLNHVRGPKSFDDLLTVDGVHYLTFKQAAEKRGLQEEDGSIRQCLAEARMVRLPSALRRLFATILVYCQPTHVRSLWEENFASMIEDYPSTSTTSDVYATNRLLHELNNILQHHKRSVKEFDLPPITATFDDAGSVTSIIAQELNLPISHDDLSAVAKLNEGQLHAFNTISNAIRRKESTSFFVDGPGGTGKTFLYRTLLASMRNEGIIILATASSGISANQLPGGRTAHSKLKIPIKLDSGSMCFISKQSEMSQLLSCTSAIIWDEAPMTNRKAIETVDRTLRDILGIDLPFGGKVMIFGGDFRQVVPVIVGGTRSQSIKASIVESYLWSGIKVMRLTHNIRAQHDQSFSNFLLRVGNGEEPTIHEDMIKIPPSMVIPWEGENSVDTLIDLIFPDLNSHSYDSEYMMDRAIITPKNDDANKLNDKVIDAFPSEEVATYYSFDSVPEDVRNLYLPEFLNSLCPGNLPPHRLHLKKGCPIMLLWNIDPKIGCCNGTRLICHKFSRNVIDAEILCGEFKGT